MKMPDEVIKYESYANQVLRFMIAMEQYPNSLKFPMPAADIELAEKLMQEEIREMSAGWNKYIKAQSLENMTEFVDGAIDTIYVILWTLNKMGVPADACFTEVQRSNMAKLQPDGTVRKNEFGKVQKPPGWTAPDLLGLLMAARDGATYVGGMRK